MGNLIAGLDFMLRVALIPRGVKVMPKTSLHAFKAKDTRFVGDWLKSKGLHKLFSVFEGIEEPFILSLASKSVVLNHVYIHSFRSIIKATEKFPGEGAFDHLEWTYDGAFEQLFGLGRGEFEQKVCKKYKCPGVARGEVEASI